MNTDTVLMDTHGCYYIDYCYKVGRKERKSGIYGGCFVENGRIMLLARPGLRIWIANDHGKVILNVHV